MSGGACFSPRLKVRPAYPSRLKVLTGTLAGYVRVSTMCTVLTYAAWTAFNSFVVTALGWGLNENAVFALLVTIVHTGCYTSINGFFLACEHQGWLEQYRFERKPIQKVKWKLLLKTWTEAFIGQLVTGPVVAYFGYEAFRYFGMPLLASGSLPPFWSIFASFWLAHFFNDVGFYWSHRLVHHKKLYALIHKQHHTYTGSIGFAAEYAHPVEQIFSNSLPSIGGCLFFGAHPLVFFVWLAARLQQTYEGHSGYCFYGTFLHRIGFTNANGAAYHDYHHSGNRGNFGALWLDYLGGTMDAWIELGGTEGYIRSCNELRKDQKSD